MTQIIAVSSCKGGVGKTTVAVNLALALKEFGKNVILVDCNLSTPHVNYYLGTFNYTTTLNDVLKNKADIGGATYFYDGISYVPSSLEIEDIVGLDVRKIKNILTDLLDPAKYDYVVLDSAPGLGKEALAVLEAADQIILVTTPFVPAVMDMNKTAEVAKTLGNKKFGLVINMVTNGAYEFNDVKMLSDYPILGTVPYDKNILRAVSAGQPVVKYKLHSQASVGFLKIAAKILGYDYKPSLTTYVVRFLDSIVTSLIPGRPRVTEVAELP